MVRKTASVFEFSLCLSRACLGKTIVWRKNAVFLFETALFLECLGAPSVCPEPVLANDRFSQDIN
jgi:hypothetical protein